MMDFDNAISCLIPRTLVEEKLPATSDAEPLLSSGIGSGLHTMLFYVNLINWSSDFYETGIIWSQSVSFTVNASNT